MGDASKWLAAKPGRLEMAKATCIAFVNGGIEAKIPFGSPTTANAWAELVVAGKIARANARGWKTRHDAAGFAGVLVIVKEDGAATGETFAYGNVPAEALARLAEGKVTALALPAAGATVEGTATFAADTVTPNMLPAGHAVAALPAAPAAKPRATRKVKATAK